MKSTLLVTILLFTCVSVWGETFDLRYDATDTKSADWNIVQNGITLAFSKGTAQNTPSPNKEGSVRMYANTTLTISSTMGNITNISFVPKGDNYGASNLSYNSNAISNNWDVPTPTTSIVLTATGNARFQEITVTVGSSCAAPSATSNGTITKNSATVSWTSDKEAWDIYYSDVNTAPTTQSGTAVNTNPSYTFTGLSASTTYYWWVRTNCGSGSTSTWKAGSSFTTSAITYTDYITQCAPATQCAAPTFSVASGTYDVAKSLVLSTTTEGATIYYTTDGQTPTASSKEYTKAIPLKSDVTIKAIAIKDDLNNSDVVGAAYVFNYSVTFDMKGHGTQITALSDVKYNTTISAPTAPEEMGYTFDGWYKENTLDNKWDFTKDKVTANTTLYAKWTINKYTVTWMAGGQQFAQSTNVDYNTALAVPSPAPTKDNCDGEKVFRGWTASENYGPEAQGPNDMFTEAGDKKVTTDVTYYAVFATKQDGGGSKTLSLNFANNNYDIGTGWLSSDATIEVDGITLKYYKASVSNKVLNLAGSNNFGYFSNTTDMGSISQIEVTLSEGNVTYKTGSSAMGSYQNDGTYLYSTSTLTDLSGGYFNISGGNTTGKISALTITYSKDSYSDFGTACTPTAKKPSLTAATTYPTSTFDVTITNNEEGATVYYTTDGVDPTTNSSSFTGASKVIEISATTTVKAMAMITDKDPSAIVSAEYTKVVPKTSIQAIQEAATTEEQTVYITFNDWVVTGVDSNEDDNYDIVYVSDGTEYGLEMDLSYNSGFALGQKLSGTIAATLKKTSPEKANIVYIYDLGEGLSKTTGGTEKVIDKTIPTVSVVNNGAVVAINAVTYHDDNSNPYFYDASDNKIYFYNVFAVGNVWSYLTDGAVYNIQGLVIYYTDGKKSIACRTASEFVECLATPTNLAVSNITATGMTVSWTAVDNATSYDVIVNGGDPISVTTNSKELTGLNACTEYTIQVIAKATGYVSSQPAQIVENTISDETITINLTNTQEADGNLYKSGSASVLPCTAAEISLTYSVTDDYDLPETIAVTIGGATATAGTDYTWSAATGVVIIPAAKQTGSIVITINSPETSKTYYRLNFDKNGGSGDDMAEIKRVSTATEAELTIVLPTCTFTPPKGKEFNFWSLSTTSPSEVTQVTLSQENTVVYAIWKDITYTLESISVKTNPKTAYQENEELDLTGLVLNANYSASYGEGKTEEVTSGYTSTPEEGIKLTQNTNVVITYQQKTCTLAVTVSPTCSITYNYKLGTLAQGAPTAVAQGGTFTYPTVTVTEAQCPAGYTFAGWTANKDFAGGASAPSDLKATGATSATVSANVVLYAVYNKSKTTATTFAEFAADSKMNSSLFVIAAKVGDNYYALPNSGYKTSSSQASTISPVQIDITQQSALDNNKVTFVKNNTSYNIKVNNNNYLIGENSGTKLYATTGTTGYALWSMSATTPTQGTYRLTTGSRCLRYNTGNSTNKFGHYGINGQNDSPYYDVELIPVPVTTADYSLNPECKAERALELVSSEGTEIRLIEGETVDSKTTAIKAKDGTGSEGAITLSYSGSESAYVSIDGANVTFTKDGTYLIDAEQAATQSYAATSAKITITVNKAFVTLTYDGNGATEGVPAAVTEIVKGTSVNAALGNDMVYGQNAFDKWGTTPEGGTFYNAGASVTMNKSMTLYAQWITAYAVNIPEFAHGTITASPAYAKAGVEVTLTIEPEDGYVLRPNSLKVLKENGEKVYCPESTGKFDMPASNVTISAEFVKGALYKQNRVNQQLICEQSGSYPDGATATFVSTYATGTNGQNKAQLIDGTNMTYSIKGYEGNMIKGITLSMHSNKSAGAGTMYVKVGDKTVAQIATATDFNQWFDNRAYSQNDFVDVHVTMPKAYVSTGEDIVIYLACTTKSLYCESVFIEWAEITTTRTITGTYGTVCLAKGVEAGNYVGGSFYEGDYLLMDGDRPYKYYLTEVDHLEAGYPYVFVKDQNADAIYVAETGDAVTKAESKKGLVGTLEQIDPAESNALTGNYMIVDNLFCECGAWCGLYANRAYLNINAGDLPRESVEQPAPVGVRRLVLTNQAANTPNTPTAIDNLTEDGVKADAAAQKFIIDEKLVIIRGGKMYNASGAIVK